MEHTRIAYVKLNIDPTDYQAESGEELTPEALVEIGRSVNHDAASILGYMSWEIGFEERVILNHAEQLSVIYTDGGITTPDEQLES